MVKEERFEIILKKLKKGAPVTYESLASVLSVSEDTVRRDIDYLHQNGLLSKVRGGAMARSKDPLLFEDRTSFATNEKKIIALKAQRFIKKNMTLFMDGGTTICAIARHFPRDISLRVITNNLTLIPLLKQFTNIEIVALGGSYLKDIAITAGVATCSQAAEYIADLYFMGSCALHPTIGVSATTKEDADVKRAMCQAAKAVMVLAVQQKLRRTEAFKITDIHQVDALITNLPGDHEELIDFRNLGPQIV